MKIFYHGDILVRPFRAGDARALHRATRDSIEEVCSWMVWCRPDYSIQDTVRFLSQTARQMDSGERYSFAIMDRADTLLLGSVGLSGIDRTHRFATVGYWVRSGWTGRGIGSAAAYLAARFGFQELGLHRLELIVPVGNSASEKVASRIGAQREGILRNRVVLQGEARPALMMSLLPGDLISCEARLPSEASSDQLFRGTDFGTKWGRCRTSADPKQENYDCAAPLPFPSWRGAD